MRSFLEPRQPNSTTRSSALRLAWKAPWEQHLSIDRATVKVEWRWISNEIIWISRQIVRQIIGIIDGSQISLISWMVMIIRIAHSKYISTDGCSSSIPITGHYSWWQPTSPSPLRVPSSAHLGSSTSSAPGPSRAESQWAEEPIIFEPSRGDVPPALLL